jgi:SAM-dependent methyltransferase
MLPSLYHAHHDRHNEDLPFWLSLAEQWGNPVLELGCGTGRVLIPLAEAGYRTVGLDYDLSMLEFLNLNLSPQAQPEPLLVAADICRFHLAARFPLIILPCNTFSTLDDNHRKACLESIQQHLAEGGIFAISIPNPEMLMELPAGSEAELEDQFIHPQTGNPVQVSSSWKRAKYQLIVTWTYDHLLPDGTVQRLVLETGHYLTSSETYIKEVEAAGLTVKEVYGDYDCAGYQSASPSMILLAVRHMY